jgi:hypothetical protein
MKQDEKGEGRKKQRKRETSRHTQRWGDREARKRQRHGGTARETEKAVTERGRCTEEGKNWERVRKGGRE